ncbi:hypothetical protein [Paenibacillus amylolyticus]|uniref:hypothetical protein n=1 Tax=Paenibacillus amylolyticus TaxID=1451 RepID=UPI00201E6174|nr:hypothetical protein [Paenibacillus amylolyticus]MCL6663365.1 hypothetical protein [Paenibacillus amylolyticus]
MKGPSVRYCHIEWGDDPTIPQMATLLSMIYLQVAKKQCTSFRHMINWHSISNMFE